MTSRNLVWLALCAPLALSGCPTEGEPIPPEVDPIDIELQDNAEGTNPIHRMLPWPSDQWLVPDESTVTGQRLEYSEAAMPRNLNGEFFDAAPYRRLDGFSQGSQPMVTFGGELDMSNLAEEYEYDESLAADSPTVLINLETGERIAHFIQPDMRVEELDPGTETMIHIHPAVSLPPQTQIGVAFRKSVTFADGSALPDWEQFGALRDGTITTSANLEARRPRYERLFAALEADGVPRDDLRFAWTFTTGSDEAVVSDLLAMRDDAMERVPVGGGQCTITSVETWEETCEVSEDPECQADAEQRARIKGTFRSPLYMEREFPPTLALRDPATDMPTFNDWHEVEFTMIVPHVAYDGTDSTRFVAYGHGLMGSKGEVQGSYPQEMISRHNMIFAAADMHGMSEWDIVSVGQALADMSKFPFVTERLMQGHINMLVLARSMVGGCREMPELADYGMPTTLPLGDDPPYYHGISQGSIFGAVHAAISLDITHAAIMVGGTNYSIMIPRSSNFPDYELIFLPWYARRLDQQVMLSVIMSIWDKSEPSGFTHRVTQNPLPGTQAKRVLHTAAVNDSQVPNLSSDIMARTMGIPLFTPSSREVWGMETVTEADQPTSALVYYDFDRPLGASGNVPPPGDNDVHGDLRFLEASQQQISAFFRPDGVIEDFCDQGDGAGCSPE
ncbi:MAG: hypothetical protein KDA24_20805 [Deltaproteobacteria bacterium]|nr:hypothetical protein [Deltaproteobacteria bacterium]